MARYLEECEEATLEISKVRQQILLGLAEYMYNKFKVKKPVKLLFICTHNSRRSQMAQLAAKSAAIYYNLKNVETYSGGSEHTAFNLNAIQAIKSVGYKVEEVSGGDNPRYKIAISKTESDTFFSKLYSDSSNPPTGFAVVTVCSDADRACPYVHGAEARFALPFEDPKINDDSLYVAEAYQKTFSEITKEMMFAFNESF